MSCFLSILSFCLSFGTALMASITQSGTLHIIYIHTAQSVWFISKVQKQSISISQCNIEETNKKTVSLKIMSK